ncbi:MAG: folate family ECF transporter S component [Ruminococcus sp.]|nr:folate family ECF transporter S component [Ruminococcus sp.]
MSKVRKITDSANELKSVYALTAIAMLLALRVVLGFFANATLPFFGNSVKVSGAFLPIAVAGQMFGPIPGALVGALGDIISFIMQPATGGYFPGFTISGLLTGFIYGMAFYKQKVTIKRTITAWLINMVAVETFLAAFWLYLLYGAGQGTPYTVYLTTRFISVGVKCVPEILLIFAVGTLTSKIKIPKKVKA